MRSQDDGCPVPAAAGSSEDAGAQSARWSGGALRRRGGSLAHSLTIAGALALAGMLLPAAAYAATGGITGIVTNSVTHTAIENVEVCADPTAAGSVKCEDTASNGEYLIKELQPGKYNLELDADGYAGQTITGVEVTSATNKTVNVALTELGKVSGKVTLGGAPAAHVDACVTFFIFSECDETNAAGEYTIENLSEGSDKVRFDPPETCTARLCSSVYITEFWNGAFSEETSTPVKVTLGTTTTGIDSELQLGGRIAGTVTNAGTGQPAANVYVCAISASKTEGACNFTNAAGEYSLTGLASGSYEVDFEGDVCSEAGKEETCEHSYVGQYRQALVAVSAPATTAAIDASLLERGHEKPVDTAAPTITGTPGAGSVLSCSTGSWSNDPTGFTYQWLRNGAAIAGQTEPTYTVQSADEGTSLSCQVTAGSTAGPVAASSAALPVPKPAAGIASVAAVSIKQATVSITLSCSGASACMGTLQLVTKFTVKVGRHKKLETRSVVIGTASFSLALGARATLHVHLSSEGQKLLHAARSKGLKVQVAGSELVARTVLVK
jgi:Carboxypeptidase regulatory-like domain